MNPTCLRPFPMLLALCLSLSGCSLPDFSTSSDSTDSSGSSGSYSITGTLTPEAANLVDADVNDIYNDYASNDTLAKAQEIGNLVTVQGFASRVATRGRLSGDVALERFASSPDEFDYYKASLQAGQTISLETIDYDSSVYPGDLDLYLFDDIGNEISHSKDDGQYDSVTVPDDGSYYIVVNAYEGVSKYILQITPADSTATAASDNFVANQMLVKTVTTDLSAGKSLASVTRIASVSAASSERPALVTLTDGVSRARTAMASGNASARQQSLAELEALGGNGAARLATLWAIKDMSQNSDVEFAEPNHIRQPLLTPDDTYFSKQWNLATINLPQTWELTTGSRIDGHPVIVAVVDTGVFLNHPDLAGQLVSGYDFISDPTMSNDGDGIDNNPDDPGDSTQRGLSSWHGTHVAGIVGALSDNGLGVTGISWGVKIMPVRVLGIGGGTTYDIIQGIYYAAGLANSSGNLPDQAADVINLSLGGYTYSSSEQAAVTAAWNAGSVVVAAAGNEATSQRNYPAAYEHAIAVSATTYDDELAPYSNYGSYVDIAAPGGDTSRDVNHDGSADGIVSTLVSDSTGSRQATYKIYQGTSMAAPHVAGVIALMKAVYPELTPTMIKQMLANGDLTEDLGSSGFDNSFGYGRINALKAVSATLQQAGDSNFELPVILASTPAQLTLGTVSSATLVISNTGGGSPEITSATTSANWLGLSASNVDSAGLGTYLVSIDRTNLVDGSYSGTLEFASGDGDSLSVRVNMTVGSNPDTGILARQYVLAFDTGNKLVGSVLAETDGSYALELPAGNYHIYSGSDLDVDNYICGHGESCGAWPSLALPGTITVSNQDVTSVDFTVSIESTASGNTLLTRQVDTGKRLPTGVLND